MDDVEVVGCKPYCEHLVVIQSMYQCPVCGVRYTVELGPEEVNDEDSAPGASGIR